MEMACQIIHDSIHHRPGWTQEYVLRAGGVDVGYGSVAVGGPWKGKPTVYEFYVFEPQRVRVFELFRALLDASRAKMIEVQSNDGLAALMVHAFAREVASHSILFHDVLTTTYAPPGANFRAPSPSEAPNVPTDQLRWHGVLETEGRIVANGGILFHYNPPFGDIFMDVDEPYRCRGFGSYLVQELKRVCYAGGYIPAARCNQDNLASRRTLLKAGFAPCGYMLAGQVSV
jgi:GNAT superfamily N-acetyltransferase